MFFAEGSKKRKMDTTEDDRNDTMNSSAGSIGMSSWETKLLRSDLIEAQTKVILDHLDVISVILHHGIIHFRYLN